MKVQKELRANRDAMDEVDKDFYESILHHLRDEKDVLIAATRRDGDSNDGR